MYGQGTEDSDQLADASNKERELGERTLGTVTKDDRNVSYGMSWWVPAVLAQIIYASEGIQFHWRKRQQPCSSASQKRRPGIRLPDLANENTECPVKFQVVHGTHLYFKKKKRLY